MGSPTMNSPSVRPASRGAPPPESAGVSLPTGTVAETSTAAVYQSAPEAVHDAEVERLPAVGELLRRERVQVQGIAGLDHPVVAEVARGVEDHRVARLVLDRREGADVAA